MSKGGASFLNKMNIENNFAKNLHTTALFLTDSSNNAVEPGGIIMPQRIKLRQNIGYTAKNGVITINDAGEYFVSFCISAANSGSLKDFISVSFNQLTPSKVIVANSSIINVQQNEHCTLIGCAIFTATAGSTYAFLNNSKSTISVSPNNLATTNITIFRIN